MGHLPHGGDHSVLPPIVALKNEYVEENREAGVPMESWVISWDKLQIGSTVLGAGNFGEVREGVVWQKDKAVRVAIKSLKGKLKENTRNC